MTTTRYGHDVEECLDTLMEHGTDRYGKVHAPVLVSILDVDTRTCPTEPAALDEYVRVTRRARRAPGGSNLLADQPLLKTMYALSAATGKNQYREFADRYAGHVMTNLVDDKGFFWWGWHRYYDVHRDLTLGADYHLATDGTHEIHANHAIAWDRLWAMNQDAVKKEIEAIWQWHVVDKATGEVNRHGDGARGCDFSMSAGAFIEAFCFLHGKTGERNWLDRARLLADYYWNRRNMDTNLIPERPNAGAYRFDGGCFTTSVTGLHCHSLLLAWEMTGEAVFRDYALAYLKAYARYGYDEKTGRFWGALKLDGTPIPGPRVFAANVDSEAGYEAVQPRGHLDLWQPYLLGYEHPLSTAQNYAYAYQVTGDAGMLVTAKCFAEWIRKTPPDAPPAEGAWYRDYSNGPGKKGAYAEHYGRAIAFFIHLYALTADDAYLRDARAMADAAIAALWSNGLFRGHPAKPYYEAADGVGYLLHALLELDLTLKNCDEITKRRRLDLPGGETLRLDNW